MGHTLPHLKMSPSEYFKRNWWISFDPEEAALKMTVDWLGADRIIWGSDYPHPDAFYPGFVQMLNENLEGVPEEDQAKIPRPQRRRLLPARRLGARKAPTSRSGGSPRR